MGPQWGRMTRLLDKGLGVWKVVHRHDQTIELGWIAQTAGAGFEAWTGVDSPHPGQIVARGRTCEYCAETLFRYWAENPDRRMPTNRNE